MLVGAGGQREDLQGLQQYQHAGPRHVVQDDIGHMDDIPDKANQQYHPKLVGQGAATREQGEGACGGDHCDGEAAGAVAGDGPQLHGVHDAKKCWWFLF